MGADTSCYWYPAAVGLVDANPLVPPNSQFRIHLGCQCLYLYEKPFMWYLLKFLLKVQVDKVHYFVVTCVVGVDDTGKEVKQAC